MNWTKRFVTDTRASVALLFAAAALPILLTVGAAVDFSVAQNSKTQLQALADAAVLGGLRSRGAEALTAQNAFDAQNVMAGVQRSFQLTGDTLEARASMQVPTTFMKLAGIPSISVEVYAKALRSATTATPSGHPASWLWQREQTRRCW